MSFGFLPAPFYLQSDPVALMHGDMIRHCTQKLDLKKKNKMDFTLELSSELRIIIYMTPL